MLPFVFSSEHFCPQLCAVNIGFFLLGGAFKANPDRKHLRANVVNRKIAIYQTERDHLVEGFVSGIGPQEPFSPEETTWRSIGKDLYNK